MRRTLGNRWLDPEAAEITDIIPFNEFGELDDLDFHDNSAFDRESQVIHAPELDDMADTDDLIPLRLAVPSSSGRTRAKSAAHAHAYRDSKTDVSDGIAATDIIDMRPSRRASTARTTAAPSRAA